MWETAVNDPKVPLGTRLALSSLDPRNVTLEPEYYADELELPDDERISSGVGHCQCAVTLS